MFEEVWMPKGGWNKGFSEKDKVECMNLFIFLKKTYKEHIAEMLAHMILFKQKYGVIYSFDQENLIKDALITWQKH